MIKAFGIRVALAAIAALAAVPAARGATGGAVVDLAMIDAQVSAFTGAGIGQPGGAAQPVDRRLRLPNCPAPLALSWRGPAQATVMVQCPGGWRLFVPVMADAAPAAAAPVVAKGEVVTVAVRGDGFAVSQPGEALDAGAVGAWIRVKPGEKREPIRAQVIRPGLVEVRED